MSASSKKARRATGPSPKGDTGDEPSTKANGTDGLPQAVVDELPGALVEVVARLTNVRELEGGGYVAHCPVCGEDDKFTVIAGETQPVVVNCYRASCSAHDGHVLGIVAEALGVEESVLLDPTHVPSDKIRTQFTERHRVAAQQKKAPEPLPTEGSVAGCRAALEGKADRLAYLTSRGLSDETITTYELGWDVDRHCYTIPVRSAAGELVNLREHRPNRKAKMKGLGERGSQLYPSPDFAKDGKQEQASSLNRMAGLDSDVCCESMRLQLEWVCVDHPDPPYCADKLVDRRSTGEHVLLIHDGGTSGVVIAFCPWCGRSLPVTS